jgi:FAD/FMN-containing dehydrogenase
MSVSTAPAGALEDLRSSLRGDLVFPGDQSYDEARHIWNARWDRRPTALARCTGVADVQSAVRFARERDIPFTIRAGGHEVDGWGIADDVLALDLTPMNGVIVDPVSQRAIVQAGARLGALDREAAVHSLAVTAGTVSDTGVAGLTLGGGLGWLMRKHGATVDNVLGIDAVTADGEVVHASATEHQDLFWGMRGGGGNFAIATAFHLQLHPLPPTILAGAIVHPGEVTPEWVRAWRDFMLPAPDEVGSMVVLLRAPAAVWPAEMANKPISVTIFSYAGEIAEAEKVLKPIRDWGTPIADMIAPTLYTKLQRSFEESLPMGLGTYQTCGFVPDMTDEFTERIGDLYNNAPAPEPGEEDLATFALSPFGGEISRIPEETAALPRGNAKFYWENIAGNRHPEDNDKWHGWVDEVDRILRPLGGPQLYLNHHSALGKDQAFMEYTFGPEKYARLVELKNRWDPTNVFRFNKNIKPSV